MMDLTRENYAREVGQAELPVLIDFSADWYAPCRTMEATIQHLSREYGHKCKFLRVDIDAQEGLADQFDIFQIPTLILMQEDEVIQRISGLRSREEILQILNLN